jgi:uncharacterized phage protein (TIGR02218 family)
MRDIPAALAAALAGETATLAHLWRFTRRDGGVFGFTDHDEALIVEGQLYSAAEGLEALRIEKSASLAVDSSGVEGVLSSAAVSDADLAAGLWDGARCDVWRCDWRAPEARVHLFAGQVGEVRRGPEGFTAELRGLQAALNAPVGRVYARACDAELGDARCGVDLAAPGRRFTGVVAAVLGGRAFEAVGLEAAPEGWLAAGRLLWDSGEASRVLSHRGAVLELAAAPSRLAPGAAFTVAVGCDKQLSTCRDRFANVVNFRGFPHMPGPDAVIAAAGGPVRGGA